MSTVAYSESRRINQLKALFAVGVLTLVAGCSTASDRFGPFDTASQADPGNPNGSMYTGSANQGSADGGDFSRDVAAAPLDTPSSQAATPAYQQASYSPQNGEVTVQQGQTLYSISRARNVSVGDLISLNNLQAPYSIQTGQRLRIPATATAQAASYTQSGSSNVRAADLPTTHTVAVGETLYSISRSYGHRAQTVAAYNDLPDASVVRIGQSLRIPAANWSPSNARSASQQAAPSAPALIPASVAPAQEPLVPAPAQPQTTPATNANERGDQAEAASQASIPARTSSRFRWPVLGRVIAEFGSRADGSRNDGINMAVPEGTSIKAAENGVVAYAGNELQGYGNLILIRHADNWVTAYAHASEILVRRGDVVSRGQIIAKAGQTGNVTSPQLHFEIRQGAQAVDPMQHLAPNSVAGD
jgi:murein DD-endopeptidase MepM/ murein hydrolase activator NlpD